MAMTFDRSAVQEYFEDVLECNDPLDMKGKSEALVNIILDRNYTGDLSRCIDIDISSLYERAIFTFFQGILDLDRGRETWAAIKLYYSVFYLLRAEMHLNGKSPVRCEKKLFLVKAEKGSKAERFNNDSRGDHGIAIEVNKRFLRDSDLMQSAKIDEIDVYSWMKSIREDVQYKMRVMPELKNFPIFYSPKNQTYVDQLNVFLSDDEPYYCFDPEFAALAIPVTRLKMTSDNLRRAGRVCDLSSRRALDELIRPAICAKVFEACCEGVFRD